MEEETVFERLACERNITVEEMQAIISARIEAGMNDPDPEKRAQWEGYPAPGRYPRRKSGSGMRWGGLRPKGAAICCAGIRTFEYGCISIKTAEMNSIAGDLLAVFSCAKFY